VKHLIRLRSQALVSLVTAGVCAVAFLLVPTSSTATPRPAGNPAAAARVGAAAPAQAAAAGPLTRSTSIRGTFGSAGKVTGWFKPVRFFVRSGKPMAYGVVHTTLRRGTGALVGHSVRKVVIPLSNATNPAGSATAQNAAFTAKAAATCSILHLVLGPLNLNLLGLRVTLNRVILNIVAVPAAGALLGNLLCAVAHLLDGPLLSQLRIANILNRLLNNLRIA
jgi:hypothetical protein